MHSTISEDSRGNDCPTSCSSTTEVRGLDENEDALSNEEDEEEQLFAGIIAAIDIRQLQAFVLAIRKETSPNLTDDVICTVHHPPRTGSYNIVYEVVFSDNVRWAIRIPAAGDVFSPTFAQTMHLDIVAQRLVASKTSTPLPHIHHWSVDAQNALGRPFMITDFVMGTNLSKVWNDSQWITDAKREIIFKQLARWMAELAALEFGQIGRLEVDETSGTCVVVPFPELSTLIVFADDETPPPVLGPAGPFNSAHAFLSCVLHARRSLGDSPMLVMLQLFLSVLPDPALDGPPFVLGHTDYDSQNIIVADDGTITGIIDWDGIYVGPRQGGAMAYPSWLTVDWDPLFYGWAEDNSDEENGRYDSPTELIKYRRAYLDAVDTASNGKLTQCTRNSHIWQALWIAITNEMATAPIVSRLSKLLFGDEVLGYEIQTGISEGQWYRTGKGDIVELSAE